MKRILIITLCLLLLTSCGGKVITYVPYEEIPAEYTLEDAKADSLVVHENGNITSGESVWDDFFATSQKGIPCMVRLAEYYTLDKQGISPEYYEEIKDDYPRLYISDLSYDGGKYTLYYKTEGEKYSREYMFLRRFEDTTPPAGAKHYDAVHYFLINSADATMEQIRRAMTSSAYTALQWSNVYSKYNFKEEYK